MDAVTVVDESNGTEAGPVAGSDAQRPSRRHTIKPAQIAFGGAAFDCALLDASPGGARVHLLAFAEMPEIATLRLRSGESWTVRRQWQQGAQAGFAFVGTAPPPPAG